MTYIDDADITDGGTGPGLRAVQIWTCRERFPVSVHVQLFVWQGARAPRSKNRTLGGYRKGEKCEVNPQI